MGNKMRIELPEICAVIVTGEPGERAQAFLSEHFWPDERMEVHDEAAITARLMRGEICALDMTLREAEDRRRIAAIAKDYDCEAVAIVFNYGKRKADEWVSMLKKEGLRRVIVVDPQTQPDDIKIRRLPMPVDRREDHGPFDIIGDVHGCFDELHKLLARLGYRVDPHAMQARHPLGRKAVFLGDLVDRGPKVVEVMRLVMNMCRDGSALCVLGNHDEKLMRKLGGANVEVSAGLMASLQQLERTTADFSARLANFIASLEDHYVLDGGALVVAHAGLKEAYQGRVSSRVRAFALYGQTTGKVNGGKPVREDWAREYTGSAMVVYGHTPHETPYATHNTLNIDTGGVFGGHLTAFSYPEGIITAVRVHRAYAKH